MRFRSRLDADRDKGGFVFLKQSSTQEIISTGFEFDSGIIFYNHFRNAASYVVTRRPFAGVSAITENDALSAYDDVDTDDLENFTQMTLANSIFYSQLQSITSEQSSRMSAMENASTNAQDMIDALTLQYNRSRQAVITTELIEIISGASAME
jgi:F-type H+-transporting ATPase subunit gamma